MVDPGQKAEKVKGDTLLGRTVHGKNIHPGIIHSIHFRVVFAWRPLKTAVKYRRQRINVIFFAQFCNCVSL